MRSRKSKVGHIQLATNFDHEIVIGAGRPKPETFETKRYAQVTEQMAIIALIRRLQIMSVEQSRISSSLLQIWWKC